MVVILDRHLGELFEGCSIFGAVSDPGLREHAGRRNRPDCAFFLEVGWTARHGYQTALHLPNPDGKHNVVMTTCYREDCFTKRRPASRAPIGNIEDRNTAFA